jgi:hypothetical protein
LAPRWNGCTWNGCTWTCQLDQAIAKGRFTDAVILYITAATTPT